MVEFCDGSIKAQMGAPDMRLAIQYALGYPERLPQEYETLDLLKNKELTFEEPNTEKFPCLRLAREASERGGLYPAILNAVNEIAVEAFLQSQIGFDDIPQIIELTMKKSPQDDTTIDIERIFDADRKAREYAKDFITGTKS